MVSWETRTGSHLFYCRRYKDITTILREQEPEYSSQVLGMPLEFQVLMRHHADTLQMYGRTIRH